MHSVISAQLKDIKHDQASHMPHFGGGGGGAWNSDSACKQTEKIVTSSAVPGQMKFYTKCKISGILEHSSFIIKHVKLQLPNLPKHPSANTSILLLFPKNHRQLLSFIHFTIISFIN